MARKILTQMSNSALRNIRHRFQYLEQIYWKHLTYPISKNESLKLSIYQKIWYLNDIIQDFTYYIYWKNDTELLITIRFTWLRTNEGEKKVNSIWFQANDISWKAFIKRGKTWQFSIGNGNPCFLESNYSLKLR